MNGAMMSATSRLAMASAVGLLLSFGSAQAADLGGNCCADLEERVAELEATTARKGNRKVSLTISGQVDKQIMFMRDDVRSRTIAGVDNINNSSRFIFSGDAKISPSVKAGFEFMVEWNGSSRSDLINQTSTDRHNSPVLDGSNISGDGSLAVRTANWWLEDKMLGRVTVGRVNIQGPASIIDISGGDVQLVAWSNPTLQGGGMFLANNANGTLATNTLGQILGYCYGCSREEGIRYDSASFGGLTFGTFWGEQDRFSVQFRYATEMHGFQIAAGGGYQHDNNLAGFLATTAPGARSDLEQQAYALSIKHVASGIFVQGNTGRTNWKMFAGDATGGKSDGTMWQVQAGIAKNWFGPGVTALYGEFGNGQGYADGSSATSAVTSPAAGNVFASKLGGTFISSSSADYYGLGMTQKIDSAAMTLYLGWRHFNVDVTTGGAGGGQQNISDIDTVIGGARIQF